MIRLLRCGSITAIYAVLAEGEDLEDPIVDHVRSIVDGHVVLTRRLANRNHYPAIDVLESLSRVMAEVVDESAAKYAAKLRDDLAHTGAYGEQLQRLGIEVIHAPFCRSIKDVMEQRGEEFDVFCIGSSSAAQDIVAAIHRRFPRANIIHRLRQ